MTMLIDINKLKNILSENNYSIVIQSEMGEILTFNDRGVKTLIKIIDNNPSFLKNAILADKVIGKAAALLMVFGGVKEVFALVISTPALMVLEKNNITVSFDLLTERIKNRKGDGLCPMESLCLNIDNPETAYEKLKENLNSL